MTIGDRIRAAAARKGWDQGELSRQSGVSVNTLSRLSQGATDQPRGSTLNKLTKALGISAEELLGTASLNSPAVTGISDQASVASANVSRQPVVEQLRQQRPDLFAHWGERDWREFANMAGAEPTTVAAMSAIQSVNQRRETCRRLDVILETHLRDVAIELIETLHGMVQGSSRTDR